MNPKPLLMFVAAALGACTVGEAGESPTGPSCGEPPELPYVCPDDSFPCECVDAGDGTGQWECSDCPPVDCEQTPDDPVCAQDRSCIGCHGLATSEGGQGIENVHPWSYIPCVDCHGGTGVDPDAPDRQLSQEEAHVPIPAEIAQGDSVSVPERTYYRNYYLARAGVESLEGGLEWLRFTNPGDLRVVEQTCSRSDCHADMDDKVRRSVMSTVTGKFSMMPYMMGVPRPEELTEPLGDDSFAKRLAVWGATHVKDPDWDPDTSPPGSVPELVPIETFDRETDRPFGTYTEQDMVKETVNKLCGTCHLGHNGKNNSFGNFRSAGCTACHMPYSWSGQSESSDPMINKQEPTYPAAYTQIQYPERPHPTRHVLERTMTSEECLACHTGSARMTFQYMGIRTDDNRDLTRARANGADIDFEYADLIDNERNPEAKLHGFTQDQLIEYEDLNGDGRDDTPADVHHEAGMECIDCHTATDMHGDGRIYSGQNQAVEVKCSSCHGNLEYTADPDSEENPINELYRESGNEYRKYLWRFDEAPSYGETGYPAVSGPGIWLRTKSKRKWLWVPQIEWGVQWDPGDQDCFGDGRRVDPRTGQFVCNAKSSIAHGRWQGLNENAGDLDDGVGPRPGVEVTQGSDGQTDQVRFGFSHLGEPATGPDDEPASGLECSSCHSTWHNMRYGNHMGIKDVDDDGNKLYDWDRVTGEVTIGTQGWFNFTYISLLDQQLGVNAEGKISWLTPTRMKVFTRNRVYDPSTAAAVELMSQFGDDNFVWKTYRDRIGFGNLVQGAAEGIEQSPGYAQICLEPIGYCDQDTRKNINGGLGMHTAEPHATQKKAKDCTSCHLDPAGSNIDRVSAVYGWNPQGFTPATSAYLNAIDEITAPHGTYSTADGFVIADDGIEHRLDYLVDEDTGYPFVGTAHVRVDDGRDGRPGRGYETYDPNGAGPITKPLIERLKKVRVESLYVGQ